MGEPHVASSRVGWIAALVLGAAYGGLALAIDVPKTAGGFWSDESTYYLMGHSLARDGDLEYRREDLVRTRQEFRSGPAGVFLRQGRDVTGIRLVSTPPFVAIDGGPDLDSTRLFYGKSFIYPLCAAPFVWLFGTNGFLFLNAILLGVAFLAGYTFLGARSGTAASLLLAGGFLMAAIVPLYAVWIMPEVFNLTLGIAAYFLWLYKYVAPSGVPGFRARFLHPWTDFAAAALIGIATFSKLTNAILVGPMVLWLLWRRQWRQAFGAAAVFAVMTIGLFGVNVAIQGDWNYQGSPRNTFYDDKPYPFQEPGVGFEVGSDRARDESLVEIIFDPEVFWVNLRANARYFFVGRYSGLIPYFFPGAFAMLLFLLYRRVRTGWGWLALGAVLLHGLVQIVVQPYTYFGSGGSVGDRYFMGVYGACLFLFPPMRSIVGALLPWVIGGLFVGKAILSPFHYSLRPYLVANDGPLRVLPVELTNVVDLPINTEGGRVPIWYGEPGFQIYYLDQNSYLKETDRSFWIRGESRAEMLIKTDILDFRWLQLTLAAGPVPTTATVKFGTETQVISLRAEESTLLRMALGPGFPYKKDRKVPVLVWVLSIASSAGFTPAPTPTVRDTRFLGVRVTPMLIR
jgi:hypothetical protein